MPSGSSIRNRSDVVTLQTPRGAVEVAHQEMRGLRRGSGWQRFWVAHRVGRPEWIQAATPREAIRRAMLLPAGKPPSWLIAAAADAQRLTLPTEQPDP